MLIRRNMIAARRSAFTLIEVLVVVAIIIILASVGTIAYMQFFEDAKADNARNNMMALEQAARSLELKNGGQPITSLEELAPYLEKGNQQLFDPWNNPYQFRYIQFPGSPRLRIQFFCNNMDKGGEEIVWPRN